MINTIKQWINPVPKPESKEWQALKLLLPTGTLSVRTEVFYANRLRYTVKFTDGHLTFEYCAMRKAFFGHVEFYLKNNLILYVSSIMNDEIPQYNKAINLVKEYFAVDDLAKEFQAKYEIAQKKKDDLVDSVLTSVINRD